MAKTSDKDGSKDAKAGDGEAKARRTGKGKRVAKKKVGGLTAEPSLDPPRSEAEAESRLYEAGRNGVANGHAMKATALETYLAVATILALVAANAKAFAARFVDAMTVKGVQAIAARFKKYAVVDASAATNPPAAATKHARGEAAARSGSNPVSTPPAAIAVTAANFVTSRRRGLARLARGAKNKAQRHDFGLGDPLTAERPATVVTGLQKLVSGKKAHPNTKPGRYITADDVTRATDYATQVAALVGSLDTAKKSEQQDSTEERILQTALELFFDDYGAAAEVVFEDDPKARVEALTLIPRRKEQRGGTASEDESGDTSDEDNAAA